MRDKTSREILLIKERYGISDNDPVFALLDVYGSLLQDLNGSLRAVKEAQTIAHSSLQDIKQEELTLAEFVKDRRVDIAEQGIKVANILNENMNAKLQELFASINEYRNGIENERRLLNYDRTNDQNSLKSLFSQFIEEKDSQRMKNKISFGLITLLIIIQSVSVVTLLKFLS
jgi:hypothetical protein